MWESDFKDDLMEYKCCKNDYQQKFDEKLKGRFSNIYRFSNYDSNKFILLLRKGVCPYGCINDLKIFNET